MAERLTDQEMPVTAARTPAPQESLQAVGRRPVKTRDRQPEREDV
jgi:hypothetical protein